MRGATGKAQEAITRLYEKAGYQKPKMIWLTTPRDYTEELHKSHTLDVAEGQRIAVWNLLPRPDTARLGALRYYKEPVVQRVEDAISRVVPAPRNGVRLNNLWGPHVYGPQQARDFALADFLRTERHRVLDPILKTAQHCGLFIPHAGAVVFLERPSEIHLDERSRLHSFDGPAVVYRDGSGIFAIHGITVPRKWINAPADELDIGEVMREQNAEIRGALLAKYGFARLLKNVAHKVVSRHRGNSLIEFQFPGRKWESRERPGIATLKLRALHLKWKDKTGPKETILPVPRTLRQFGADRADRPPNINSCEHVRRWTLGWSKEAIAVAET